jgi:aminopeptidase N
MKTADTTARDILTQAEAEARALRISKTAYTFALELTRGAPDYQGDVTIQFDCTAGGDTFLDFRGREITLFEVNGQAVTPEWTGYRLTIPGASLKASNSVRIRYVNDYDHTGDGFHQFIDPEDGEEYLYSNFEPYEAHRLFPCFDQPDIKATYELTVLAPAEWEVVANSREIARSDDGNGRTRHVYAKTGSFSTYLFAIVAGPYEGFTQVHGEIPVGLYCRRSMARHFDKDEVFTITKQGLDFYAEFFDCPYPFDKYDQVFVPEFNAGAMENVGCVTHNEFMVFRDPPTENQRRERAEVVLHEMAHMWFGDLVTMKWWNDLWLNESFATYMSYLCMTSATRFTTGWQEFNSGIKNWAYRQDQLVTTHPISGTVADTDETFLNFDGITYGKGASVLKQLVAAIGMEGFREGMRHYFRTHAWGNTTLPQFLAALETGSGVDLKEWSRLWLETSSLNTISADWEADGERITSMVLRQTFPADYPTIRPHTLELGLVRDVDGELTVTSLPATLAASEAEVEAARGLPKPSLVFPNHNDHAYAKVALDPESLAFTREHIDRIEDPMLRQMLWSALWNMTRDQQLTSVDFLAIIRDKIATEASTELVDAVLGFAQTTLSRFVPDEWREEQGRQLFASAWETLKTAEGDRQIIWTRALVGFAVTAADIERLAALADGTETVPGSDPGPGHALGDRHEDERLRPAGRPCPARGGACRRSVGPGPARHPHRRDDPPRCGREGRRLGEVPRRGLRLPEAHAGGDGRLQPLAPEDAARALLRRLLRPGGGNLRGLGERAGDRLLLDPLARLPGGTGDDRARPEDPRGAPGPHPAGAHPARGDRRTRPGAQVPGFRKIVKHSGPAQHSQLATQHSPGVVKWAHGRARRPAGARIGACRPLVQRRGRTASARRRAHRPGRLPGHPRARAGA